MRMTGGKPLFYVDEAKRRLVVQQDVFPKDATDA